MSRDICLRCLETSQNGGGGIRTLVGGKPPETVFETAAFNRSATPPGRSTDRLLAGASSSKDQAPDRRSGGLSPCPKERAKKFAALLRKQPARDGGAVIERGNVQDVDDAPARARLRIARTEHDARDAREHDRARAHRAWL